MQWIYSPGPTAPRLAPLSDKWLKTIHSQVHVLEQNSRDLAQQLIVYQQRVKTLQSKLADRDSLSAELTRLKLTVEDERRQFRQLERAKSEAEGRELSLQSTLKRRSEQLQQARSLVGQRKGQLQRVKDQLSEALQLVRCKQDALGRLLQLTETLKQKLNISQTSRTRLEEALRAKTQEAVLLRAEGERAKERQQKTKMQTMARSSNDQLWTSQAEFKRKSDLQRINHLAAQNRAAAKKLEEREAKLLLAQKGWQEREQEVQKLKRQQSQLEKERQVWLAKGQSQRRRTRQAQVQVAQLQQFVQFLKQKLQSGQQRITELCRDKQGLVFELQRFMRAAQC